MDKQIYRKKIAFWLRFSGWLCLLPASLWLWVYQILTPSNYTGLAICELVIIILFAAFILTTAKSDYWLKTKNIFWLLLVTLLFISFLIFIPLCFAYNDCRIFNNR
jgi:hypothetical protein